MMRIFNGTPHPINFYKDEDTYREDPRRIFLKEGSKPFFTLEAGQPLNAKTSNCPAPEVDFPIPLKGAMVFVDAEPIPVGYDLVVVSNLYRSACVELGRDTSKLATVSDPVYEKVGDNVRPVGCLALCVG